MVKEYDLQCQVVQYLKLQYPEVEFRSDMGGIRLSKGLAVKAKKANGGRRAWPDLFIAEPTGEFHGLFIEIKRDLSEVYKKDGGIRKSEHISEQHEKLMKLRSKGYCAEFGCGLDQCIRIIDNYLSGHYDTKFNRI